MNEAKNKELWKREEKGKKKKWWIKIGRGIWTLSMFYTVIQNGILSLILSYGQQWQRLCGQQQLPIKWIKVEVTFWWQKEFCLKNDIKWAFWKMVRRAKKKKRKEEFFRQGFTVWTINLFSSFFFPPFYRFMLSGFLSYKNFFTCIF